MKIAFFPLLFLVVLFQMRPHLTLGQDISSLEWLTGKWKQTNHQPGETATEEWVKAGSGELQGIGVTMKGDDTVALERMRIVAGNGKLIFIAIVTGNHAPVSFPVTTVARQEFVCENPQHDFPKKISYHRNGNELKASISGNGKPIDYLFERQP